MIFETVEYTNNAGTTLQLGDENLPAKEFHMKMYQANDAVKRTQFPGRFPTYSYAEYREFYFAGDILGDDAADYNDKVREMRYALQPPYGYLAPRKHGRLKLTFYGDAEEYYADVILSELDIPKLANYPSVGDYTVTFLAFLPYLVKTSDDSVVTNY